MEIILVMIPKTPFPWVQLLMIYVCQLYCQNKNETLIKIILHSTWVISTLPTLNHNYKKKKKTSILNEKSGCISSDINPSSKALAWSKTKQQRRKYSDAALETDFHYNKTWAIETVSLLVVWKFILVYSLESSESRSLYLTSRPACIPFST